MLSLAVRWAGLVMSVMYSAAEMVTTSRPPTKEWAATTVSHQGDPAVYLRSKVDCDQLCKVAIRTS